MATRLNLDKRIVPVAQLNVAIQRFLVKGYSLELLLDGTGLTEEFLNEESNRASYRQRILLLENLIRTSPEPAFWLTEPLETSISSYGLLGYAMMSSATLSRGIAIATKYHKMAGAMFDLEFLEENGQGILRIHNLLAKGVAGQLLVEELFRGIQPLISLLLGRDHNPLEICLSYSAPAHLHLYKDAFRCPVKFDQLFCEYRFDAGILEEPLAEADATTAKACERSCQDLLKEMGIDEDLVSRICQILLSVPGKFPSLDEIASKLYLGPRTLRRRLKTLDTSYQKILDDVRKELAIQYLVTTDLSTQQISDLLGYTEVTNFRRAFLKWADTSPFKYRKQMLLTPLHQPSLI